MGRFPQDRESDLRVLAEPKWTVRFLELAGHIYMKKFFSTVFRMTFLTGQSSYHTVYLQRQVTPKKHLTSPCFADKAIYLDRLTGTIPYLIITQNSPLIYLGPNCSSLRCTIQIWQDAY